MTITLAQSCQKWCICLETNSIGCDSPVSPFDAPRSQFDAMNSLHESVTKYANRSTSTERNLNVNPVDRNKSD